MTEKYDFGADYQKLVLASLIQRPNELSYAVPCVKGAYFTSVEATLAAEQLLDYYNAYARFPTFTVLTELVATAEANTTGSRDAESSAVAYARDLADIDTSDWQYVALTIVKFAKEMAHRSTVLKVVELMRTNKIPAGGVGPMFDELQAIGQNLDDVGVIFHEDIAKTVREVTSEEYGISTGYPILDEIWKNGWKPGWLVVPLAPPKGFKTSLCLGIALRMISPAHAYDVIYYACEIDQKLALMRTVCNMCNLDMDQAYSATEGFIDIAERTVLEKAAGFLLFKSFASKSTTISEIRIHAKAAITRLSTKNRAFKPKAIFIDYAETVRPTSRGKSEADYREQANIYTDARALAAELGVVVIMPDRCNRETVGMAVPNMKSFQGAFEKAGIVDVAFGICATDEEYQQKLIRLFVFLNRHGPAFQHIQGRVDPSKYRIELDALIPYEPEEKAPKRGHSENKGRKVKVPDELLDDRA